MRVSVVTPSFNQGAFLEQTILSVLNQSHFDVEYLILDGGSTDGSRAIIEKYKDRLAFWHSEPDRGFADAVNKGWQKSSGEILCYLNSDDLLYPQALSTVVDLFEKNPDAGLIYGDAQEIDEKGDATKLLPGFPFDLAKIFSTWQDPVRQPSAFFRRRLWEQFGGLDESFQFCADFEYFVRVSGGSHFLYVPTVFSSMRTHSAAKSTAQQDIQSQELIRMFEKFRHTPLFLNCGVSETEAEIGLYRVVREHYLLAGKKWAAFAAHLKYSRAAYSGFERIYRIARFVGRLART